MGFHDISMYIAPIYTRVFVVSFWCDFKCIQFIVDSDDLSWHVLKAYFTGSGQSHGWIYNEECIEL